MGQTKLTHCFLCSQAIYRKPGELTKNKHNFCSPEHYQLWIKREWKKRWVTITCLYCERTKRVYKRFLDRKFCGRKCWNEFKMKGHQKAFINSHGYWCVLRRNKSGKRQELWVHRLIAGKALGRKLKSSEMVHHINMKKEDNRHKNLLICSNGYHAQIHFNMARKYAEEHFS